MNLTTAKPSLTSELNEFLAKVISLTSNPQLKSLLSRFEVQNLSLSKDHEKVHGRTTVEKAIEQADQIQLVLIPRTQQIAQTSNPTNPTETPNGGSEEFAKSNPQLEILEAFRTAKKGHRFVALKWFRDQWLRQQGYAWSNDPEQIKIHLRTAIDQGTLRKELLPNPNNPEYPTTTLHEGNSITESPVSPNRPLRQFSPIAIPGKPLSVSVIEGR